MWVYIYNVFQCNDINHYQLHTGAKRLLDGAKLSIGTFRIQYQYGVDIRLLLLMYVHYIV